MKDDLQPHVCLIEVYGAGRGIAIEQVHHEMLVQDSMDAAAPYKLTQANIATVLDDALEAMLHRSLDQITEQQYTDRIAAAAAILLRELSTYTDPADIDITA